MPVPLPPDLAVRPVLLVPTCMWCTRREAAVEGLTTITDDMRAALCEICWAERGVPDSGLWIVPAADLAPLLRAPAVKRYCRDADWVYARTMPKWPHEYVLLWRSHDPWTHLRVLAYIRARGEERPWRGRWGADELHTYWRNPEDGREYWAMPAEKGTVINRERDAGFPQGRPDAEPDDTTEVQ